MEVMTGTLRSAVRPARTAAVLVLALLLAVLGGLAVAPTATAADREVVLTADGPQPAALELPPGGGTVAFVVPDGASHTLTSDAFDAQELGGLSGRDRVEIAFTASGAITYNDRRRTVLPPSSQDFTGTVVVASPPAQQPPPQDPPPAPGSGAPPPPPPADGGGAPAPAPGAPDAAPAPPAQGGEGAAPLPPLVGGVGTAPIDGLLSSGPVVPPAIADMFGETGPLPSAAPPREPVQALQGPLPGAGTSRPLGLPAAIAALAAVGVASLLVRVLLAEPSAQRGRPLAPVTVG
jgi:hypothetical protein